MVGGTTAVVKAGAIYKMAKKKELILLSWSKDKLQILPDYNSSNNDTFSITVLKSSKTIMRQFSQLIRSSMGHL